MRSQIAILATLAVVILAEVAVPPGTGYYKELPYAQYVFPFTVAQCEPFYIFYNVTVPVSPFTFSGLDDILLINIPLGIGYLEWICNIPAGLPFNVDFPATYVVQPGSSSACLRDVTTTYSFLTYSTTAFASYTRTASPVSAATFTNVLPITSFPTGTFSTITLNPDLATATPAPPPAPSPSPTPSTKPPIAAIVGGVVGAVAFVILLVLIYVFWRRRKPPVPAGKPSLIDPQPAVVSGFSTSEMGSSPLPSPYQYPAGRPSGAEFYGSTPQYPYTPSDYRTSNSGAMNTPMPSNPTSDVVSPDRPFSAFTLPVPFQPPSGEAPGTSQYSPSSPTFSGQGPPYQGATSPFGAGQVPPPQQPREPQFGYQGPFPSPPQSVISRGSRTGDQQTSYTLSSDTPSNRDTKRPQRDAMPPSQEPSTSDTQGGSLDLRTVLGVISRAQLNPGEGGVVTSFNNLLLQGPSAQPDSVGQEYTMSPPPPYSG